MTAANAADFTLRSKAFSSGQNIPKLYSCNGKNISPQLSWTNAPANTKSFVLILWSPDWPQGTVYKWVLYNIPANIRELAEGDSDNLPETISKGQNSMGDDLYRGPCPPDDKPHRYIFTLYAVDDADLDIASSPQPEEVLSKLKRVTIEKTELAGIFKH